MKSAKVGNRTIVENNYVNNQLVSETYGNSTNNEYVYDEHDNIIAQKFNGNVIYECTYDSEGKMLTYTDHIENVYYSFTYDDDNEEVLSVSADNGFSINYNTDMKRQRIQFMRTLMVRRRMNLIIQIRQLTLSQADSL